MTQHGQAFPSDLTPYGPGKYDYLIDSIAHSASLDGCDDECGDVATTDWFGILRGPLKFGPPFADVCPEDARKLSLADRTFLRNHKAGCILRETDQGFVHVTWYSDADLRDEAWAVIQQTVETAEFSED